MSDPDPFVGRKVLGRYRIVRSIGRGGMGLIYLARQEGAAAFVKPVVVKRAAPELIAKEKSLVQIMGREARIMSHLRHPSIVSVIDFAQEDGAYLLVLDYVHGFHLGQWQRFARASGRSIPVDLAIYIVCKVLDALHYAHTVRGPDGAALGIVHRDVSPSNVLLDVDGSVKLADFGIARMHSDHTEETGQAGMLKGKFAFMAPELITQATPSPKTDLYAAGVLLHEVLAGRNELRVTDSIEATIARILKHVPSAISKLRPDVPVGLDEVLAKALEKDPERRFTDAAAFAHTLRSLNGQTDEALALRLQASVGADFRDPRIAVALDVPDLASLDRSWREYSDDGVMASSQKAQSVSPPTVVHPTGSHPGATRSQIAARPNGPRGRNVLPWVVGALVSLLAIGGGLWVRTYRDRMESVAPPPAVIIVDGRVSGADGLVLDAGSSATPPASTSQSSADPTPPPRTVPPIPPTAVTHAQNGGGGGGADGLTRAFARQQPQVARCFDANAAELSGAPKIEIRFDVDASGHVSSAQVLPAAIAPTPLGACLAGVARATQFGPQASSVSFRIPITATAHRGP